MDDASEAYKQLAGACLAERIWYHRTCDAFEQPYLDNDERNFELNIACGLFFVAQQNRQKALKRVMRLAAK